MLDDENIVDARLAILQRRVARYSQAAVLIGQRLLAAEEGERLGRRARAEENRLQSERELHNA